MELVYNNGIILQNGEKVPFVKYHDLYKSNTLQEISVNLLFDESEDERIDFVLFTLNQLCYYSRFYESRVKITIRITFSDRGGSIIKNESLFHAIWEINNEEKNNMYVYVTNHILVSACVIFAEFAPNLKELKIHVPYKDMDDALQCGVFLEDHLSFVERYVSAPFNLDLQDGYQRLTDRCLKQKGKLDPCVWESIYYEDCE